MKIAVIGAAGQSGRRIADQARERGHEVIGFGRTERPGIDQVKDVFEITKDDLAGFDVVVDALGFFTPDTLPLHVKSLNHLTDLLDGTDIRLLVVGGAGSLYVDPEHTTQLKDTPEFPAEFKDLATAQAKQLDELRTRGDVAWTYVSPAADFGTDYDREGTYELTGEEFTVGSDGQSRISYDDYATSINDLAESSEHIRERVSVRAK